MPKLLVVEDEAPNLEILRRLLSRQYELVIAENRQDAVSQAVAQQPDLILMDITLPDSPDSEERNPTAGIEATRELKSLDATRHIPIIAMTASVLPQDKKRYTDAGFNGVQEKPFEFAAFLENIRRQLE
jgi:CheY-like chemotaxis protein